MNKPEFLVYKKPETPEPNEQENPDIINWVTEIVRDVPERGDKPEPLMFEDRTYWEEGKVSPETMNLIKKTKAVQDAFYELREKRGEMGEKDVRHMIRVAELMKFALDSCEIELTSQDRRDLMVAALCHDVGKADPQVKNALEKNKGQDLPANDREVVQKHVNASYDFLMARGEDRVARIQIGHHENSSDEKRSYPRREDRRKEDVPIEDDRRIGERREADPDEDRLRRFLSIVDKFESIGSKDRPYNRNKKARDLLVAREGGLEKFDSPEELQMIAMLEKADLNNLRQRAEKEAYIEAEAVREETRRLEDYTSS